jgi:hypothetical protein
MNKKLLSITAATIASASIYSFSGSAVAADGTATVTVQQALSITDASIDLAFGTVISPAAAETVTIAPNGTVTGSLTTTGTTTAGVFTVSGEDTKEYVVTVPSADVTLTDGGTNTIIVNAFTYDAGLGVGVNGEAVSTGAPLNIGATLNVGADQAAGDYSGTYVVTVNYN